ncbi:MAG: citrate lyase ligase [Betaproteobacteria bacterium HGW-Betaproteobacteria-12]|nr:MAG: citrate lyase ligase [Betaproteobacteria bacterium HGW-Betaproteobacteria-12]
MIVPLTAAADLASARALIEGHGLRYEAGFDALFGSHDDGELVAVGARAGNVLKMLTVAAAHRGGSLLGEIVSALVANGLEAGCATLFIYTKPPLARSFETLNFTRLAAQDAVAWLEFGHGLRHWLAAQQALCRPGANGALFVDDAAAAGDCRPQIEAAARRADHLYLFVDGAAGRSERLRQATRGIADTIVVDSGPYRSGARVPTYFLPADAPLARIGAELDATLFAARIAPFFGIVRCFADSEAAAETAGEMAATQRILAAHGIAPAALSSAFHPHPNPGGIR